MNMVILEVTMPTRSAECEGCSEKDTENHKWNKGIVKIKSTEDKNGIMIYTCSACSKAKTEAIPKSNGGYKRNYKDKNDDNKDNNIIDINIPPENKDSGKNNYPCYTGCLR
ncbi:hypothetical protein [uncultured Anaerofustis sp.]|uniref:hypothetical protein n=1 Tax=uncultured Anaerofustis sp. TaxID=904996 RepID=UPI0025F3F327|nr:hypothetical protein [uncultured Anaerofustis sp.]